MNVQMLEGDLNFLPKGDLKKARQFTAGNLKQSNTSPEGTAESRELSRCPAG
jgi:hypothetical protein